MSEPKEQFCTWCGAPLGVYAWNEASDGPQDCGKLECQRGVRNMIDAQGEQARYEAEQDGYSLYGGPGRW